MAAAKSASQPFHRVLFEETSRIARRSDVVRAVVHELRQYGVSCYFVARHLDSQEQSFDFTLVLEAAIPDMTDAKPKNR
jgi:DNA invertase Pin-like site-specific DNA recombinase